MKITNRQNLPAQFISACQSEHTYTPKRYSVTSLLKGTCETILTRRHDGEIERDASEMVWLIFGKAVHKVLEEGQEGETELKEEWLSMPFGALPGAYIMSGIFDSYDDATETVTDWKTASVWKVKFNDWADYRKQTMCYCLLLRHAGFHASNGRIIALLKDHSMTEAQRDPSYPKDPVFTIEWHFTDEELAALEDELKQRFERIAIEERKPDEWLSPCSPEERWEKPPKFAVMKGSNKRAVKLYDSEKEAAEAAEDLNNQGKGKAEYWVQSRPGECTKCVKYCNVTKWCSFYRHEIEGGGDE